MSDKLELSISEIKALLDILEHEYISIEKELAHDVIRKMQKFIKEND